MVFYLRRDHLDDGRFAAGTIEMGAHLRAELNGAVLAGEKGVVCRANHVRAGDILGTALAKDHLADHDFLAVLKLHAKALCDRIAA